jgi:hypothetical protein
LISRIWRKEEKEKEEKEAFLSTDSHGLTRISIQNANPFDHGEQNAFVLLRELRG